MTLVLTWACPACVVQVTDRLLLLRKTGKPFDCFANKSLIYLCKDALVTLGYTGDAYVGGMPTDDWIAQVLSGVSVANTKFCFKTGPNPNQFHFGKAIKALNESLGKELVNQTDKFELTIAGWKWGSGMKHSKRAVPIITTIAYIPGAGTKVTALPRHWHFRNMTVQGSPDANISNADLQNIATKLKAAKTIDSAVGTLVEAVRGVANINPSVGNDCMSINIPPPHRTKFARAKFHPMGVTKGVLYPSNRTVHVAFSPWIITPGSLVKPSVMVGTAENIFGDWVIRIEAPESNGLLAAWSSQARPKLK